MLWMPKVYTGSKQIKFFKEKQLFLHSYQVLCKFSISYLQLSALKNTTQNMKSKCYLWLKLDASLDKLHFTLRTLYVLFDTDTDVVCLLSQFSSSVTEDGWCLTWQCGTSDLEASEIQHWRLCFLSKWQELDNFTLHLTFLGGISGQYLASALVWWLRERCSDKTCCF